jgi:hypothetical protein
VKTIIITGMPRSGTSWLGQIINSVPGVLFRTEPLFSYRFKDQLDVDSSCAKINDFIGSLVDLDDDFILQKQNHAAGFYPEFRKDSTVALAFKTTRHHELIESYLSCVDDIHVIAIVRHPCGSINSWFKSYREFAKKNCNQADDWRTGKCRKTSAGEYWGFDDWLAVTKKFLRLANAHQNFHLVRYSDLVLDAVQCVATLFESIGIEMTQQTLEFLSDCHARHDQDPYSVFKTKAVVDVWKTELNARIAETIINETNASGLNYFLG